MAIVSNYILFLKLLVLVQWRDPSLKEVIEYLDSPDKEKQRNASGYLQHLTFKDQLIKDETRDYGGIPKLVNLLRNEIPAIQKNAAACLKNLSFGRDNDKNKVHPFSYCTFIYSDGDSSL